MSTKTSTYHTLPVISLREGSTYSHPPIPPVLLHWDDSALDAMQDLKLANAITIAPTALLPDAEVEMRVCHTHLLLVIDENQQVLGLLSSEHLLGERPLKISQERKVKRAEIPVRAVMNPRERIVAFNIKI